MSFSIKQFATGIGLKPVSADPSNPTQGQLQYADGTVRAEGLWRYDGTAWQQVGSGAGSYDIFFQENLETNTSSNFTSGQNASPDAAGTGTLDGTLADEESSQISGDRSLKYTMNATAASSNNDFFINDTDIALETKQKGQFVGVTFYYTYSGADDDIRFFVLDQDDNELTQSDEYIKSNSTATRFSTSVFIPSDDTAIRYGFQVVTGNSSKVFIVDDIEFSTNPFVYKNLIQRNTVNLEGNDGRAVTAVTESIPFSGTATGWTSGADGSTHANGNYYTVQYDNSIIKLKMSVIHGGTPNNCVLHLHVNGSASVDRVIGFEYDASVATIQANYVSTLGEFSAGDTISFSLNQTATLSNNVVNHFLNIVEEAEAEHVVTPAKVVDENYIARGWSSWGSTATMIPVFSTEIINDTGNLIQISNTAADGLVITALKDVVVTASYNLRSPTGNGMDRGWSLNASSVTTNVQSLSGDEVLGYSQNSSITGESVEPPTVVNVKLQAGDVLRPHTNASGTPASTTSARVSISARAAEAEFLAAVPMNYTQTKYLSADVSTDATTLTDLTFNNLVVGKMYEINLHARILGNSNGVMEIEVTHNGSIIANRQWDGISGNNIGETASSIIKFVAEASTVTFVTNSNNAPNITLIGNGTGSETFAQITELNYTKETTRFT